MIKLIYKNNNYYNIKNEWDDNITLSQLKSLPKNLNRTIIINFFESGMAYSFQVKKRLMQALRNCDEIGICNELWESLDSLTEFDYFFLYNDNVGVFPPSEFNLIYNLEEIH